MVNPGAFRGSRIAFLVSQKPEYAVSVKERTISETVSLIQRRYFKRYPVDLPHDEEPTDEHLASIDDDAADPEVAGCEDDSDSDDKIEDLDSTEAVLSDSEKRAQLIRYRKGYKKDNGITKDKSGLNPYANIIQTLAGKSPKRPQSKHAMNYWRKTQAEAIESRFKAQVDAAKLSKNPITKRKYASVRESLAWEMYKALEEDDKKKWESIAEADHEAALSKYNTDLNAPASTSPEDRQRAIQGLTNFIIPVLNAICDTTGWKATLIAGGPEPADGGRLNVMSIHSGTTTGAIKMNFGCAERQGYIKNVVPLYRRFLKKCYSPDECRLRSLPATNGAMSMGMLELEADTNSTALIHTVQDSGLEGRLPQTAYSKDVSMGSPGGTGTFNNNLNPFPFDLDCSQFSPRQSHSSLQPSPVSSRSRSPDIDPDEFNGTLDFGESAPRLPVLPLTSVHLAGNMGPPLLGPQDSGWPAPIVNEQETQPLAALPMLLALPSTTQPLAAPPVPIAPPSTMPPPKKKGPTQKKKATPKAAPKARASLLSAPPVLPPTKLPRPVPQRKNNAKRPAVSAPTTAPSPNPTTSATPPNEPASANQRTTAAPSNPTAPATLPVEPARKTVKKHKGTYTYELGGPIAPRDINTLPPPGSKRARTMVKR